MHKKLNQKITTRLLARLLARLSPARLVLYGLVLASLLPVSRASAVEAVEPPPPTWSENSWGVSITGDYFRSDSNYDLARGSKSTLGGGNYLNTLTSHLRGRYAINDRLGIFAQAGLAQSAMKDLLGERSATSFTDVGGGLDFLLTKHFVNLIFEAQGGYPIDKSDPLQTQPLTSDGSPFGRVGIFAIKPFRYLRLSSYVGVDYPSVNLSKKLMYQVYGEVPLKRFLIGGGVNGFEAINDDGQSLFDRQATQLRAIGGSARFYAYNPGLLEARGWVGLRLDNRVDQHWALRLGYAQTLNGVRSAAGSSVLLSLSFNAQDLFGPSVDTLEDEARGDDSTTGFQPTVEKTDQSLFRDEPPVKPKRRRRIVPTRPKAPPATDSLDETERLLDKKN